MMRWSRAEYTLHLSIWLHLMSMIIMTLDASEVNSYPISVSHSVTRAWQRSWVRAPGNTHVYRLKALQVTREKALGTCNVYMTTTTMMVSWHTESAEKHPHVWHQLSPEHRQEINSWCSIARTHTCTTFSHWWNVTRPAASPLWRYITQEHTWWPIHNYWHTSHHITRSVWLKTQMSERSHDTWSSSLTTWHSCEKTQTHATAADHWIDVSVMSYSPVSISKQRPVYMHLTAGHIDTSPSPLNVKHKHVASVSHRNVGPTQAVSVLSISCKIRSCSVTVSRLSLSAMMARSSLTIPTEMPWRTATDRGRCNPAQSRTHAPMCRTSMTPPYWGGQDAPVKKFEVADEIF